MARRQCKCKICGASLTTDTAYKVTNNKESGYYCSKEEHEKYLSETRSKERCFETISRILNTKLITPMMRKEVNMINQFYDYIVIEKTFLECEKNISWFLQNKNDGSEYAKTKYISTIVQNNINDVYKKYIKEQEEMKKLFNKTESNNIDVDIMNFNSDSNIKLVKNDISEFLD